MSSHMFPEVERVCDRVGIIKDGKLVVVQDVTSLRQVQRKVFTVRIGDKADAAKLETAGFHIMRQRDNEIDIEVQGNYNEFIRALADCDIRALDIHQLNLEQIFMHLYGRGEAN